MTHEGLKPMLLPSAETPRRADRWIALLRVAALVLAVASGSVLAQGADQDASGEEALDRVSLAALMIKDGHYGRALKALEQVDLKSGDVDFPRYYTLLGLAHLQRQAFESAEDALFNAIYMGQDDPVIYIYLAQAQFNLEAYRGTIASLEEAGAKADNRPRLWAMRAQAHWRLDQKNTAWEVLDEATQRFPDDPSFVRQQFYWLVELQLYQQASTIAEDFLEVTGQSASSYLAIGNTFRKSDRLEKARDFLELARLRYPDNTQIAVELASTYLDRGKTLIAAELFQQLAARQPKFAQEAAELFRRGGNLYRALALNARVVEPKTKYKQRMALLLALEDFEKAATLEDAFYRAGLLSNQDLRYALAYAHYRVGDYDAAEGHLQALTRSDLVRKAAELRKTISKCQGARWQCL
jgi:predicted Zn-dependent protease